MTVAEFSALPDHFLELHHGEVVEVPPPTIKRQLIQRILRKLFERLASPGSYVEIEVPFRALPEYEMRVADVAYISPGRWENVDLNDWFLGAPDLVIEVLSPSNTAAEMFEKQQICLENGSKEFWVVDPIRRSVRIFTPDGFMRTWVSGQEISLPLFGDSKIAVDAIFNS